MTPTAEDQLIQLLKDISFSLERSASAAEATHKLYKRANEMTERHMQAREERERESNERQKEDFAMAKERHESFMRAAKDREIALRNIQEPWLNKGGGEIHAPENIT